MPPKKRKISPRYGVGSNQHKKRARVPEPFEVDGKAAIRRAETFQMIRGLNAEISTVKDSQIIKDMFSPSSLSANTSLPDDISRRLSSACAALYRKRGDMSIPQNAANLGDKNAAKSLAKALQSGVDDPSRIRVEKFRGITRKVFGTGNVLGVDGDASKIYTDHLDDTEHFVVVVTDERKKNPYVIDPTISILAPVADKNVSVDDQLGESGDTPYGDYPLVKSLADYRENSHFQWHDDTIQS